MSFPNPGRHAKFEKAANNRQPDLTLILENVHDTHNVGAVLRSAESIGMIEIFVLNSDPQLQKKKMKLGKRTSSGARKWVDVHLYNNTEQCFSKVREKYPNILGAFLGGESKSLFDLDFTVPTAILFGNEHDGITPESLKHCTGLFTIPQFGFTQSLNSSVACAITLYEACRQRIVKGFYGNHPEWNDDNKSEMLANFIERQESGYKAHTVDAKK